VEELDRPLVGLNDPQRLLAGPPLPGAGAWTAHFECQEAARCQPAVNVVQGHPPLVVRDEDLGYVPGHGHEVRPRRRHGIGVPLLPRHELVTRALARDPEHLRVRVDADHLTPAASEKHGQRPRSAT